MIFVSFFALGLCLRFHTSSGPCTCSQEGRPTGRRTRSPYPSEGRGLDCPSRAERLRPPPLVFGLTRMATGVLHTRHIVLHLDLVWIFGFPSPFFCILGCFRFALGLALSLSLAIYFVLHGCAGILAVFAHENLMTTTMMIMMRSGEMFGTDFCAQPYLKRGNVVHFSI